MKHATLFLTLCIAAAVPAGMMAADAPKNAAQAAAEAKAKAEAEAKLRRENQEKYNAGVKAYGEALAKGDVAAAEKAAMNVFACFGKPGAPENLSRYAGDLINRIRGEKKKEIQPLCRKLYEKVIALAQSDYKVAMINEYAGYLKNFKLAKPEEIAKLLEQRLQVKDLSAKCLYGVYLSIDDLAKAEAFIEKHLASVEEKDRLREMDQAISKILEKKVYGSELAAKYYKKRIDLSPTADEKARILEIYANFLKEYCLVPDEEADKIKASRWSLPGLTPAGRVSCYFEDLKAVELQSEKKAFVDKILAEFKDNAELRIKIYRQCWRIKGPAFLEKVVFSDPAVRGTKEADNPGFYKDFMREYDNRCFIGRYAEVEKFLASEEERTLNAFRNAKSESGVMAGRLNAARSRVDSLRKDDGNTHDALRNAGNNKVQRENLQKRIGDLRSQLDQAQKAESEAVTALRAADTAVKNALIRYEAVMDAQIRYFDAVSIRHYDSKNPVTLKKAIAAVQRKLDVVLPFRDDMYKVDCTIRMMNLAYAAKDDELVLRLAASIEKTIKDNAADTKNRWAYVFQDKARVVQKILALVAYRQEDYEKCIALTTPLLPFEKNWGLGVHELYEPYVRSSVAVGDLETAVKYSQKMIDAAPGWLRSRLKTQVEELKERLEESKQAAK